MCIFTCLTLFLTGCNSDNENRRLADVEYASPVHVSKNVSKRRVYSNTSAGSTKAGVIKPYSLTEDTTNTSSSKLGVVRPYSDTQVSANDESYQVKPGDTLYSVAFRYGRDYRELASQNGIEPPYNITVGQTINLKKAEAKTVKKVEPADNSSKDYYTVKSGDTLMSVTRKTGVSYSNLIKYNSLKSPYNVYVGQKLYLSERSSSKNTGKYADSTPQSVVPVAGGKTDTSSVSEKELDTASVVTTEPVKVLTGKTRKVSNVTWMWPTKGSVVKGFSSSNKGLDIAGSRGQNVNAAAEGQVVYSGNALRGYGNLIIINHNNEFLSAYAHNDMLLVKEGQRVKRGQVIAKMGSTDASRVMLHFEIRYKGNSVDPRKYLPK
ncbi:MAG: peptidoglycan DD-metalloendopeptidase family protein [Succinivibrio sp.]